MQHSGWDFQFCEGFFFHECAVIPIFYGNNDDMLVHPNIVHGRYKSIYH
jgi:hypothetical protein